jgi:putative spermidine/putrescine transport system ATP-binding protein
MVHSMEPMTGSPMVELKSVSKAFGSVVALRDVSIEVREGEFFTLLGPSGSGKTTVLRVIAGLLASDTGSVLLAGVDVTNKPPYERDLAVVFQSLALFPHMSVAENIAFPLQMRRWPRERMGRAVAEALALVQLPDIGDRKVTELSGGQRQRVALARSLVYQPRLLLLDEPLSALDRRLREDMQLELARLHRELGVTIINVTHDQREAMLVSDRIAVMNEGVVVQLGDGREIYDSPATSFVASFLGDPLLLAGMVRRQPGGNSSFEHGQFRVRVTNDAPEGAATLVLRPEQLSLVPADTPEPGRWDNSFLGSVTFAAFDGAGLFAQIHLDAGVDLTVHTAVRDSFSASVGDRVHVAWDAGDAIVLTDGG